MRFPWLTLQSYLSAVRSFGDMNILERRGTPLLAEKLEAFPIFRPNAADDMPLDRSSLVCIWVVVGVFDHGMTGFCLECPFLRIDSFMSSLLLPRCYPFTRALLPSALPLVSPNYLFVGP